MTGLSKAAWLVETSGERSGRMHSIGPEAVTIGRADDNAIVVRHANASRRHARIWHDGARWLIEDLGTKNGTLRNGEAVAEPTALQESDEIALPGFSATFHTTDETIVVAVPAVRPSSTKTFLFTDLRGYTAFTEQHGDAAASEVVAEYRRLVRAEIARTGGRERTTEGDSFFVVFDSAHSAVECALAIVRACAEHTARAPERPIRVGAGVHAGEPVAQGDDYLGLAVNVAARLCANAAAGEVLVSDVVRGLVRVADLPPMAPREGLVLKGVDDPPRVYAMKPG